MTTTPVVPVAENRSVRPSLAPIVVLLLLSPFIGEVLTGATRISYIFVFIPEVMVWGCGTLLIREAVRRWRGGGISLLLLGLALSVAEEFVIQQTSLAPLPWMGSTPIYGRVWGVNWVYFLFQLGYESVWIVLVPTAVTELIFTGRRDEPWLRTRGMVIAGLVFVLGSFIAWFAWVKRARVAVFHVPDYRPPTATILFGVLAIVLLVCAGYAMRRVGSTMSPNRTAPNPWLVLLAALVLGFPWYLPMGLIFAPRPSPPPLWIPLLAATAWAAIAIFLIQRWSSGAAWQDGHRWALSFGALLVSMTAGFAGSSVWPRIDVIGKVVLNVLAVLLMIVLARQIRRRAQT